MANQTGRIAVTLTNTGTSTWSGYALGAKVFPSGDTTGTGTPLTTGARRHDQRHRRRRRDGDGGERDAGENPGSYEICWDMVNAAGAYFSAEGGSQYCAPYTVKQYAPQVNEQAPLPGTDVDTQTPQLSASAVVPAVTRPIRSFSVRLPDRQRPQSEHGHGPAVVGLGGRATATTGPRLRP